MRRVIHGDKETVTGGILMKKYVLIFLLCMGILGLSLNAVSLMKMVPKKPSVKHGEFPFCLTFECNGKVYEVKDTLVCDYGGFAANASRGIYRKWKSYLKSGKTRITLFRNHKTEIFFTPNINNWEAGAFYMGDNEIYDKINIPFPGAWYTDDLENGKNAYIISAEEMWEKYKVKLLNWEISPPVQNSFN